MPRFLRVCACLLLTTLPLGIEPSPPSAESPRPSQADGIPRMAEETPLTFHGTLEGSFSSDSSGIAPVFGPDSFK